MNREDIKKQIHADRQQLSAETLEYIRRDPQLQAELDAAQRMDAQLQTAFKAEAPAGLLDDILAIPRHRLTSDQDDESRQWLGRWVPGLLGGAFALALGVFGVVMWQNQSSADVEKYVASHYALDVPEVLEMSKAGISAERKNAVLQQVGLDAVPALKDRIQFVKVCPTPGGEGAHMVLQTPGGLATIIYMPETELSGRDEFAVADLQVVVVPLETGSVAVMAEDLQTARDLMQSARADFRTRVRA